MIGRPLILVGTDFSHASDLALQAAEAIRKKTLGKVQVVHVTKDPSDYSWLSSDVLLKYLPENYKLEVLRTLNLRMSEQVRRCEAICTSQILFGSPHKVMHEIIKDEGVELLVLGRQGETNDYFHRGGMATRMASSSEVPVLVMNAPFKTVKIAGLIDPTEPAKSVILAAEELALHFFEELIFISLWKDIPAQPMRRSPLSNSMHLCFSDEEKQQVLQHIRDVIGKKMYLHSKGKVMADITKIKNMPEALVAKMEEEHVNLAVLCRHHKGPMEKILVGSVSRGVMDLFKGNLLVLPPESNKRSDYE